MNATLRVLAQTCHPAAAGMLSTAIPTLRFCGGVLAFIIAGLTGIVTAIWVVTYLSGARQPRSMQYICVGGAISLVFVLCALWLWGFTAFLFHR